MKSVGIAERRNTASATDPCSQCATPSRPWVASTTRSLSCSLRKSTMACDGSCNLMRMFSTSIPSLLAIVHGGSSSWESPHCASRRCACGNAKASLASYWDTCRRCNLLRAAKAMRNAWANAAALRSEKSVGCTMERMAFIAIAHTRTRDQKSMPHTCAGKNALVKIRSPPRKRGPSPPWIPAGVHPRESGGGNERSSMQSLSPQGSKTWIQTSLMRRLAFTPNRGENWRMRNDDVPGLIRTFLAPVRRRAVAARGATLACALLAASPAATLAQGPQGAATFPVGINELDYVDPHEG